MIVTPIAAPLPVAGEGFGSLLISTSTKPVADHLHSMYLIGDLARLAARRPHRVKSCARSKDSRRARTRNGYYSFSPAIKPAGMNQASLLARSVGKDFARRISH